MIRKSFENTVLNNIALSQEHARVPYWVIQKSLMEACINDFENTMSLYEAWEVADALVILDRLATLESLDKEPPGN